MEIEDNDTPFDIDAAREASEALRQLSQRKELPPLWVKCPNCGERDRLMICATIWLDVIRNDREQPETEVRDFDTEYVPASVTMCRSCWHTAPLSQFETTANPHPTKPA